MTIPDGTEPGLYWVKFKDKWAIAELWQTTKGEWGLDLLEWYSSGKPSAITELGPRILPPDNVSAPTLPPPPAPTLDQRSM